MLPQPMIYDVKVAFAVPFSAWKRQFFPSCSSSSLALALLYRLENCIIVNHRPYYKNPNIQYWPKSIARLRPIELHFNYRWATLELLLKYLWTTIELPLTYCWTTVELPLNYCWTPIELLLNYRWTTIELPLHYRWTTAEIPLNYLSFTVELHFN